MLFFALWEVRVLTFLLALPPWRVDFDFEPEARLDFFALFAPEVFADFFALVDDVPRVDFFGFARAFAGAAGSAAAGE